MKLTKLKTSHKELKMQTYKEKITQALNFAKTIEDFDYILEKIQTTSQINRRTQEGRELTKELETLWRDKLEQAINKFNLQPF